MAKTAELKIKSAFADDSARDLKFPLNPNTVNIETIRANAKAFDPAAVAGIYISEAGATCTGIAGATLFETDENEINLNVSE